MVPETREPLPASERQELQAEIAYLRTFSNVCRTHLRAYMESLPETLSAAHDHLAATTLTNGHLAASFVTMTPARTITITPAALMLDVLRELNRPVDSGRSAGNAR